MGDPSDFREIEAEFARRFAGRLTSEPPAGVSGVNLSTQTWLGYVRVGDQSVEVSTGISLLGGGRIYGVTFPRLSDGSVDPRNDCYFSLDEVERALAVEP